LIIECALQVLGQSIMVPHYDVLNAAMNGVTEVAVNLMMR
jgi:hypothetical protein